MGTPNIDNSGDGTRPTTDGGVDNIGAAGSFTPGQTDPDTGGPAPKEKMQDLRQKDRASINKDDSAPFGIHESDTIEKNTENPRA